LGDERRSDKCKWCGNTNYDSRTRRILLNGGMTTTDWMEVDDER
jgi:hypothetical protein